MLRLGPAWGSSAKSFMCCPVRVFVSPEKLLPSRRRGLFDAPDRIGSPLQLELDGREAVLDGEIVALDDRGIPSFSRLQQRMYVQRPASLLRTQVPVTYYDFDVLDIDRTGIADLPYIERREALSNLSMDHDRIKVPILAQRRRPPLMLSTYSNGEVTAGLSSQERRRRSRIRTGWGCPINISWNASSAECCRASFGEAENQSRSSAEPDTVHPLWVMTHRDLIATMGEEIESSGLTVMGGIDLVKRPHTSSFPEL